MTPGAIEYEAGRDACDARPSETFSQHPALACSRYDDLRRRTTTSLVRPHQPEEAHLALRRRESPAAQRFRAPILLHEAAGFAFRLTAGICNREGFFCKSQARTRYIVLIYSAIPHFQL